MQQSVAQNPYYFRGPTGATVPGGTHALIYRLFANHTGSVDGTLDRDSLKAFFALSGGPDSSSLVYTAGRERIPDYWYKRAPGSDYGAEGFAQDAATIARQHPGTAAFGGNTGTVNSFVGLNVTQLTVRSAWHALIIFFADDTPVYRAASTTHSRCYRATTSAASSSRCRPFSPTTWCALPASLATCWARSTR